MDKVARTEAVSRFRNRIREMRYVRARDLIPHPKNWRVHPKLQEAALLDLLTGLGIVDALLAMEMPDGRLMLVDGHLRADIDPDALWPVLVLDITEQEAEQILLTLDPLTSLAEADSERIGKLIETVRIDSDAINEVIRRAAGERLWRVLHPEEIKDADVSPDRADELRKKWGVEVGQLWGADRHRLIYGDSRDPAVVGRLWPNDDLLVRMIWTDPPWGSSYAEKNRYLNQTDRGNRIQRPITNDNLSAAETGALFRDALAAVVARCEPGASIYADVPSGPLLRYFIEGLEAAGFAHKATLVWVKDTFVIGLSDYQPQHELILYGWREGSHFFTNDRTQSSVFEVDRPRLSDLHPTTKPLELIARMISNSSRVGELVYDPFLGSGSTIVAAHHLGRMGYGCELDPGYLAVALERLALLGLTPELVTSL